MHQMMIKSLGREQRAHAIDVVDSPFARPATLRLAASLRSSRFKVEKSELCEKHERKTILQTVISTRLKTFRNTVTRDTPALAL